MTVLAGSVLVINPKLVAWPLSGLMYGVSGGDGTVARLFELPINAVRVLTAFSSARRVDSVFPNCSLECLSIISTAVDRGLLLTATVDAPETDLKSLEVFSLARLHLRGRVQNYLKFVSRRVELCRSPIVVLDDVVSAEERMATFRWLAQISYQRNDIDSLSTKQYRHWISLFSPPQDYCEVVLIVHLLAQAAKNLFPDMPLDVVRSHAYCVPFGDIQTSHIDFDEGDGITALYFANLEWDDNWGSEMLFYGESGEPEVAVSLRPGRIVVFDGNVKHRAGVPTHISGAARYTVVVRLQARPPSSSADANGASCSLRPR